MPLNTKFDKFINFAIAFDGVDSLYSIHIFDNLTEQIISLTEDAYESTENNDLTGKVFDVAVNICSF